jgi:hypothetical protein
MPVVLEVITNALYEAQVYGPGRQISAEDTAFTLSKANQLASSWSTRRNFIWQTLIQRFTLSPSQQSYTIGRGTSPVADFVADRPLGPREPGNGIKKANIILTNVSPEARVPLQLLDDMQWGSISVTDIPTTFPVAIYNDGAYPNSRLYLWGYPQQANDLELFTNRQISEFGNDSAALMAEFSMPPGYELAFTLTLGEHVCNAFGTSIPPDLREKAREARVAIRSLNSSSPKMTSDVPASASARGDGWNYRDGLFDLPS